jgi:hypothetical protein
MRGFAARRQEKGAARIGNTGKPFDELTAQKTPALRVAFWTGARGVAALDRISDTLFARLLAEPPRRNPTLSLQSGPNLLWVLRGFFASGQYDLAPAKTGRRQHCGSACRLGF